VVTGLLRGLEGLPDLLVSVVVVGTAVLAVVVVVGALITGLARRDGPLLGAVVTAGALAAGLLALVQALLGTDVTPAGGAPSQPLFGPDELPGLVAIAVVTAVVTATAPWRARGWRRLAWTAVIAVAVVGVLANPTGYEPLVALEVGWVAGAAAVVVFGAPSRRPTAAAIAKGLAAVGTPLRRLEPLSVDARGSAPYLATAADGAPLFVKALGEDERSADLLFRLYRSLQPRHLGDERPFSSLRRAVEHEALVALVARAAGARTPRLVAVATAVPNGLVLAYDAIDGRSLDRLSDDEFTDDLLAAAWAQVQVLRRHRIAHRDLRLANLFLGADGEVWAIDFGFSELAARELLLATDVAELLASSSTRVGAGRAVATAVATVGPAAVRSGLDRLQLPMLSGATRTALKDAPGSLDALRAEVTAQTAET
jgi:undecaprenyl-diphosphatase